MPAESLEDPTLPVPILIHIEHVYARNRVEHISSDLGCKVQLQNVAELYVLYVLQRRRCEEVPGKRERDLFAISTRPGGRWGLRAQYATYRRCVHAETLQIGQPPCTQGLDRIQSSSVERAPCLDGTCYIPVYVFRAEHPFAFAYGYAYPPATRAPDTQRQIAAANDNDTVRSQMPDTRLDAIYPRFALRWDRSCGTLGRAAWREGLHEAWTARYGKLKGNEKNLINTYFKNQTRPGGKWEKMQAQQGSSKELHVQTSQGHRSPVADELSAGTTKARGDVQGEQEGSGTMLLVAPNQLPAEIIGKERAQSERPAAFGLKAKDLRAKYPLSLTSERERRVQRQERPIVRRHEGVNNLVVDIELPGFSLHEVSIFYQDAGLHLFAEKTDDPKWPTNLRRFYEGSLRVGKQKVADHITCGMKEGLLRIVLEREEAEEGSDSPQDENLQILDYIPWDFN
ncbi:hypothetical protein EYR38_002004 [Pleurotus pulmonarius]|nr:hypothetical protein EYR38_002004 [Pleurotus pulmonarius]